jgi:hypothetical protein
MYTRSSASDQVGGKLQQDSGMPSLRDCPWIPLARNERIGRAATMRLVIAAVGR